LLVRVVADPGHKEVDTDPRIRLFLAELAFAPLDEAEVALDPYARTVDALEALRLADPVFLIGADEFADFLTWKDPQRVLELARLGVATRPGTERSALDAVRASVTRPDRVELFAIEPLDVSSSDIRARVAVGEPVDGLVPASVAAEVERLGLYRRP
jgi:nicotinate-nucleotide adenylyltransferase